MGLGETGLGQLLCVHSFLSLFRTDVAGMFSLIYCVMPRRDFHCASWKEDGRKAEHCGGACDCFCDYC